jgi:hypothetical protein
MTEDIGPTDSHEAGSELRPLPPRCDQIKEDLERSLDDIERLLRTRHALLICQDPKAFLSICIRGIRRRFPLPVGRRRSTQLDQAEKLRTEGSKWNEVCLAIEPNYKNWDTYRRRVFLESVQAALRGRKGRKKLLAKRQRELSSPANSSLSQPAPEAG